MASVAVNPNAIGRAPVTQVAKTTAKVMVNGDTVFTVSGGDILLTGLWAECYTANDGTATTLQYSTTNNTTSTTQTLTNASASLASLPAGTVAMCNLSALTNAPAGSTAAGVITMAFGTVRIANNSVIKTVIGVGSTTGTWKHYVRWEPAEDGGILVPAF